MDIEFKKTFFLLDRQANFSEGYILVRALSLKKSVLIVSYYM